MVNEDAQPLMVLMFVALVIVAVVGAIAWSPTPSTQWKTCPRCCGTGRIIHEDLIEVDGEYK